MAAAHLAYPDLALEKFSCTDRDQDAESFKQINERKINFVHGDAPANPDALANYTFLKKALFCSLITSPAAEWYESNIDTATPWKDIRTNFIARISDGRKKFGHRLEVSICIRKDREQIWNFLHTIKRAVDKGWPDDMNGKPNVQHYAEQAAQGRKRRQRCMDFRLRGLRPRYLQRKAQEYLIEHPNASWDNFCAQINQKEVILQVSSEFTHDVEETKAEWLHWVRKWETSKQTYKITELMPSKEISEQLLPSKKENKKLPASATFVIKTDTLQFGVAKNARRRKTNCTIWNELHKESYSYPEPWHQCCRP